MRCAPCCADLHTRWARRPFASPALWEVSQAASNAALLSDLRSVLLLGQGRAPAAGAELPLTLQRARALLRLMPWAVSFYDRVRLFREVVATERQAIQGSDDVNAGERSRVRDSVGECQVISQTPIHAIPRVACLYDD